MWTLCVNGLDIVLNISDGISCSVGNISDCDFHLPVAGKPFLLTVLCENHFIFIQDQGLQVFFNEATFTYRNITFYFRYSKKDFQIPTPSETFCHGFYNTPENREILFQIQKKLIESIQTPSEQWTQVVQTEQIITLALDSLFDPKTEIQECFSKEWRNHLYFKIWCVLSFIQEYNILSHPLKDSQVSEIMVVGPHRIFLERNGVLEQSKLQFYSKEDLHSLIQKLCGEAGRRIDESHPYCDARLRDGSRIHAIIPPLALDGPCLTIRKFFNHRHTLTDLCDAHCFPREVKYVLQNFVTKRKNILISGGTGTGKTTLLNCLSEYIQNSERIITIEDSAELALKQPHVVRLETRKGNAEGEGEVTIRDLVKNSLRMRPDRIVVGECRGAEALDMLQAMNTGHSGSLTTIHANSPQEALLRLETLVLMASSGLTLDAVRKQISSAIDVIIQLERSIVGRRKIKSIGFLSSQFSAEKQNLCTIYG